jgi:hypothetical protein
MKLIRLVIFLLVVSCGSDPGGDSSLAGDPLKDTSSKPTEAAKGSPTVDPATGTFPASLVFSDAGHLPTCDASRDKQLIYLVAEAKFQTCQNGVWTNIDIKGVKGDEGKAGAAGAEGKAGAAGVDGKDGKNGKDGAEGKEGKVGPSAVVWLYDAEGRRLGLPANLGTTNMILYTSNGRTLNLKSITEGFDFTVASGSAVDTRYQACYYESSDCTGPCFTKRSDLFGWSQNKSLMVPAKETRNINRASAAMNFWGNPSSACVSSTATPDVAYPTTQWPYTLPFYFGDANGVH